MQFINIFYVYREICCCNVIPDRRSCWGPDYFSISRCWSLTRGRRTSLLVNKGISIMFQMNRKKILFFFARKCVKDWWILVNITKAYEFIETLSYSNLVHNGFKLMNILILHIPCKFIKKILADKPFIYIFILNVNCNNWFKY